MCDDGREQLYTERNEKTGLKNKNKKFLKKYLLFIYLYCIISLVAERCGEKNRDWAIAKR